MRNEREFRDRRNGFYDQDGRLTDKAKVDPAARRLAEQRRDLLREGIDAADFDSRGRRPVFYSGRGAHERAREYVDAHPDTTIMIDDTPGGGWLEGHNTYGNDNPLRLLDTYDPARDPADSKSKYQAADDLWGRASARYTGGVADRYEGSADRGEPGVLVVLHDPDPERVYKKVEEPILIGKRVAREEL